MRKQSPRPDADTPARAPGALDVAPRSDRTAAPSRRAPSATVCGSPLRVLTTTSLICAYLLVVLGDTVRVTESGMGCASWPLCNGQFGLSGTYHALLEQSHRYAATAVTVLVAATFAAAWRHARRDHLVFRSAAVALGLIGAQVILGAITVFTHNAGWTVALHLAGAWLVVGAITVTAVGVRQAPRRAPSLPARAGAGSLPFASAVSLFALAVSGMLVLHDGASTACPSWPVCERGAAPTQLVLLQYLHRSLALITAILITVAAVRLGRSSAAGTTVRILAAASVALVAGTAAFGALVATTGAPPLEQDVHLAFGSALWIAVVALAVLAAPDRGATGPHEAPPAAVAAAR